MREEWKDRERDKNTTIRVNRYDRKRNIHAHVGEGECGMETSIDAQRCSTLTEFLSNRLNGVPNVRYHSGGGVIVLVE